MSPSSKDRDGKKPFGDLDVYTNSLSATAKFLDCYFESAKQAAVEVDVNLSYCSKLSDLTLSIGRVTTLKCYSEG